MFNITTDKVTGSFYIRWITLGLKKGFTNLFFASIDLVIHT